MSELLPYEKQLQQQLNDLPLPDENLAWADMKRRLEEDDDDGIIAWWRRGCTVWGFLLLVLLATGWWILRPEKWFTNSSKKEQVIVQQKDSSAIQRNKPAGELTGNDDKEGSEKDNELTNENDNTVTYKEPVSREIIPSNNNKPTIQQSIVQKARRPVTASSTQTAGLTTTPGRRNQRTPGKIPVNASRLDIQIQTGNRSTAIRNTDSTIRDSVFPTGINPSPVDTLVTKTDSITKPKKEETTTVKNTLKKDSSQKKKVFFTAGIAMHQQLPIAGQKLTPYSASGRKGSLADYIPSVYFRINKPDKWFIQTEFRYGAPQYAKELLYEQRSDTLGPGRSEVTSSRLKKTFYHQLPVSFNYYIRPGWSIGAGVSWNFFRGAVSEREVHRIDRQAQTDSLVSKQILSSKSDSASVFAKSYFQALFESQYQWKRFSFGARYSFGLQPYIKFNLPGSAPQQEKNSSLQVFLRYQLWRSKN
jgi:hypothetical protein